MYDVPIQVIGKVGMYVGRQKSGLQLRSMTKIPDIYR